MASIYDIDGLPPAPEPEPEKVKRGRKRVNMPGLTPSEKREGDRRLFEIVMKAFQTLEEAMIHADHNTAVKAAQIILDRSGWGPKSTVDVNTTTLDLTELTREELAERASMIAGQLRAKNTAALPDITTTSTPVKETVN